MGSDDDTTKTLAALGVGPAAKEAYLDLIRPSAQLIGRDLLMVAKLLHYILTPLEATVWGLDKVRDWLRTSLLAKLADAAPEDIQSPPPHIAGPVLLQLPFCAEQKELREMYATLLSSAMRKSKADQVHPSYVHIIQQITPDEAVLLRHLASSNNGFHLSATYSDSVGYDGPSIPDQFRAYCEAAGVASPERSDAYLDNFLRLRLLTEVQSSESEYEGPGHNRYGDYDARMTTSQYREVEVSAYGAGFLRTCAAVHGSEGAGVEE